MDVALSSLVFESDMAEEEAKAAEVNTFKLIKVEPEEKNIKKNEQSLKNVIINSGGIYPIE